MIFQILTWLLLLAPLAASPIPAGKVPLEQSAKAASINWLTMEEAAAKIKQEPRKVLIDVYTDWCGWCRKMNKGTYTDPQIVEFINKNFYAVKFDAESKKPVTLNGHTYQYNSEYRSHELAVALLQGQMSYPTTVYLNEKMEMLSPVPGYMEAKDFSKIMRYFGEDHYKSVSWKEFEKKK